MDETLPDDKFIIHLYKNNLEHLPTISKLLEWNFLFCIIEPLFDNKGEIREINKDEIKVVVIWLINGWADEKSDTKDGYELIISNTPNKARNKKTFLNILTSKDPLLHLAIETAPA